MVSNNHEKEPRTMTVIAQRPKPKRDQDRSVMDASGAPKLAPVAATKDKDAKKNILTETADKDRTDAKARHLSKGLSDAKNLIATMAKATAHGIASESDKVKRDVLDELADLGNAVRDGAREAIRNAKVEKRNVQP